MLIFYGKDAKIVLDVQIQFERCLKKELKSWRKKFQPQNSCYPYATLAIAVLKIITRDREKIRKR